MLSVQNCQEVPYFGFYCIFITKFFEKLQGGGAYVISSFTLTPPVCIYDQEQDELNFF